MVLMRLGIFSDVHGNVEALDIVLTALKEEAVNLTICLGDLVGYGSQPVC
jgi:predicted phosphodiesterase